MKQKIFNLNKQGITDLINNCVERLQQVFKTKSNLKKDESILGLRK